MPEEITQMFGKIFVAQALCDTLSTPNHGFGASGIGFGSATLPLLLLVEKEIH